MIHLRASGLRPTRQHRNGARRPGKEANAKEGISVPTVKLRIVAQPAEPNEFGQQVDLIRSSEARFDGSTKTWWLILAPETNLTRCSKPAIPGGDGISHLGGGHSRRPVAPLGACFWHPARSKSYELTEPGATASRQSTCTYGQVSGPKLARIPGFEPATPRLSVRANRYPRHAASDHAPAQPAGLPYSGERHATRRPARQPAPRQAGAPAAPGSR